MIRKIVMTVLTATLLVACKTTNTGSDWIPVEEQNAKIQLTGIFKHGYLRRHVTRINASRKEEYLDWYDGGRRLTMYYYQLPPNTFFAHRMDLQKVADIKSLNLPSPIFTTEILTFHNAVDLVEYKHARSGHSNCIVFSMAFGIKSFVSSADPVGTIWGVGTYCQSAKIVTNMAHTALSSIEFKNWTKYPEKTVAYLASIKSSESRNQSVILLSDADTNRTSRFVGSWQGVEDRMSGLLRFTRGTSEGRFSMTADGLDLKCSGTWKLHIQGDGKAKASEGNFEGICSNDEEISGHLSTLSPGTGVAEGHDGRRRSFRLSYN